MNKFVAAATVLWVECYWRCAAAFAQSDSIRAEDGSVLEKMRR